MRRRVDEPGRGGAGFRLPAEALGARRPMVMPTLDAALKQALRRADAGDWHGAHEIAQRHEGDARADWIHAVLHRLEGDLGNARYWYRRCGQTLRERESPRTELARIAAALTGTKKPRDAAAPRSPVATELKPRKKGRP